MYHPRARNDDPLTSHESAYLADAFAATQHDLILDALKMCGPRGAEQIAEYTLMDAYAVRKRLPELQRLGLAAPTGGQRQTKSGRSERIWRLT